MSAWVTRYAGMSAYGDEVQVQERNDCSEYRVIQIGRVDGGKEVRIANHSTPGLVIDQLWNIGFDCAIRAAIGSEKT